MKKIPCKVRLHGMKKIPCKVRLHGVRKETVIEFDSIAQAKRWLALCWIRPYTIVRLK
jgi:hypothetical protein